MEARRGPSSVPRRRGRSARPRRWRRSASRPPAPRPGPRRARLGDRAVERDDVDLGPAARSASGTSRGPSRRGRSARARRERHQLLRERLADGPLGHDVGHDPARAQRLGRAGPMTAILGPASARASRTQQERLDGVGQVSTTGRSRAGRAARRAAPRSGWWASRRPRAQRLQPRREPLAWTRARVTATLTPASGPSPNQASSSCSAATGPTSVRRGRGGPARRAPPASCAARAGRAGCRAR